MFFSASEALGVGSSAAMCLNCGVCPRAFCAAGSHPFPLFQSFASGVGHNPDAISSVRGIDGDSRNNKRLCGVAESFQVRKHLVEAHADVASNILANKPAWPDGAYKSSNLRPEVAVISLAFALPGDTEWLAWVSGRENSDICKLIAR